MKILKNIIERGGKTIALLTSINDNMDPLTLDDLKELLKKLPKLEDELNAFASELAVISTNQTLMPTGEDGSNHNCDSIGRTPIKLMPNRRQNPVCGSWL